MESVYVNYTMLDLEIVKELHKKKIFGGNFEMDFHYQYAMLLCGVYISNIQVYIV